MISTDASFELFDGQAAAFDLRAGLPDEYCREISAAVIEIAGLVPGDLILEIGPGTGQIGQWFSPPLRYVGIDKSEAMLKQFQGRTRLAANSQAIVRADASRIWPLAGGVAKAIFSSRAIHLLDREHVASEAFRVASPAGATVIIGRVERDRESVRARMAKEMNKRLREYGHEGHRGEQHNRKLFEICLRRGAQTLEPVTVARWNVTTSARQSLDSWRSHKGLGGVPVPSEIKDEILTGLETWAEEAFGGLDSRFESEQRYVLKPLRIPPAQAG